MSEGKEIDTYYYLPLFLHYYNLLPQDSLSLPFDHFLALAKGIEVIEARRTHGLVTAMNIVLNSDNDKFNELVNLAFDINTEIDISGEDEDDTMKRLDDFIEKLTRGFR